MAKKYIGDIGIEDPMDRLHGTIRLLSQLQSSFNDATETRERINTRRMESIQNRWTQMIDTVDWEDETQINSMRDNIQAQGAQHLKQYPALQEELNMTISTANNMLNKGLTAHRKFDTARSNIDEALIKAQEIATNNYNQYFAKGQLIPNDVLDGQLDSVRDIFKTLTTDVATMSTYKTALRSKWADAGETIQSAGWANGVLLQQFQEVILPNEQKLIMGALSGKMGINEIKAGWNQEVLNVTRQWQAGRTNYEHSLGVSGKRWDLLNDFIKRYENTVGEEVHKNVGKLNILHAPDDTSGAGEYLEALIDTKTKKEITPETLRVYERTRDGYASSHYKEYIGNDTATAIEQIKNDLFQAQGQYVRKNAEYRDLQKRAGIIERDFHENFMLTEWGGKVPWDTDEAWSDLNVSQAARDAWSTMSSDEQLDTGLNEEQYYIAYDAGTLDDDDKNIDFSDVKTDDRFMMPNDFSISDVVGKYDVNVENLQALMNEKGIVDSLGNAIEVDGIWGNSTAQGYSMLIEDKLGLDVETGKPLAGGPADLDGDEEGVEWNKLNNTQKQEWNNKYKQAIKSNIHLSRLGVREYYNAEIKRLEKPKIKKTTKAIDVDSFVQSIKMNELTSMNNSTRKKIDSILNATKWHQTPNYRHVITLVKKYKQSKDETSRAMNKKKLEDYIAKKSWE